jgi:hypothetical protein
MRERTNWGALLSGEGRAEDIGAAGNQLFVGRVLRAVVAPQCGALRTPYVTDHQYRIWVSGSSETTT